MMKDGGAAFPVPEVTNLNGDVVSAASYGMSLRDYIAIEALPTVTRLIPINYARGSLPEGLPDEWLKVVPAVCYRMADAMLAERERER